MDKAATPVEFARKFKLISTKAAGDSGFYFNTRRKRIEYHDGPRMRAAIALDDLLGDPEAEFERWSDSIFGRASAGG